VATLGWDGPRPHCRQRRHARKRPARLAQDGSPRCLGALPLGFQPQHFLEQGDCSQPLPHMRVGPRRRPVGVDPVGLQLDGLLQLLDGLPVLLGRLELEAGLEAL